MRHGKACTVSVRARQGHTTPRSLGPAYSTLENEKELKVFPLDLDHSLAVNSLEPSQWLVASYRDCLVADIAALGGLSWMLHDVPWAHGAETALITACNNVYQGSWVTRQFGCKTLGLNEAIAQGASAKPG